MTANLGTGRGYRVLEMVKAFSATCGKPVPYRLVARRTLGWQAQLGIEAMCADTWRWQQWATENMT